MALEALRQAAAAELLALIDEEAAGFPAQDSLRAALQSRGKLLRHEPGFCWGLLPVLVCEAAGGDPRLALPLGAATECFIAAADTFDDIQDDDASDALCRSSGLPTAVSVGMLLLFLTQLGIGRLGRRGVGPTKVAEVVQIFADAGARACIGQQRDIERATALDLDETEYLEIIAQKSASLVRCTCRAAATLATEKQADILAFADFGSNLGMALQISNDVAAVSSESGDRSDLRIGKRTLPMIYALECAPMPAREELAVLLSSSSIRALQAEEIDRIQGILTSAGALHYATVIAGVYWERARDCLGRVAGLDKTKLSDLVANLHFC